MSSWTNRISSHAVWQQLQSLGPVVDQGLAREGLEPSAFDALARLKAVLIFIGRRLEAADSLLIQAGPLDNISGAVQNATAEVQAFISNGNIGHLSNANAHADTALAYLAQVNVPVSSADLGALRDAADAYHAALETSLQAVQSPVATAQAEVSALRTRLAELANEVATERQRLSSLVSEYQSQFSVAQETRSKDYLEAQSARQEKFATLITEYSQRLTDQHADFTRQGEALLRGHEGQLHQLTEGYRDTAGQVLLQIQDHKTQVEKLVGVIGNLGITSGYQKMANEARLTAVVWQLIALVALGGIIVVAYKAFLPLVQGVFSWESFAGRVFVSVTVGLLAAYAISQADKYQQVERRSRKLALELEALGPFIATLPSDKQEEFKLRIGDRTFGTASDLIDSRSAESPKSVIDVALKSKELRALIVEVIKATRGGAGA